MRAFACLLRREVWEHPSLYWVPVIVGITMLTGTLLALAFAHNLDVDITGESEIQWHYEVPDDGTQPHMQRGETLHSLLVRFAQRDAAERAATIHDAMYAGAAAFQAVMLIWMIIYALDALYGERRDRSILFWKSLPVSDGTTVLSKAATALLLVPLVTFAVIVITQLLLLGLASLVIGAEGLSPAQILWGAARPFAFWGKLLVVHLVRVLWFAPVIAWMLLISAWARRLPGLYALVIPAASIVMENLILGSNHLAAALGSRFANPGTGLGPKVSIDMPSQDPRQPVEALLSLDLYSLLGLPALWMGLALAGALLIASARVRRLRDAYGSG